MNLAEKSKSTGKEASNGDQILRPKKGMDFKALNTGKTTAKLSKMVSKMPKQKAGPRERSSKKDDDVSLSPSTSDDDLDQDKVDTSTAGNTSNSASPVDQADEEGDDTDMESEGSDNADQESDGLKDQQMERRVKKMVGKCLKKYKNKSKKKKKGKKRRKRYPSSSSDSGSSSESSTEEFTSSEDDKSSDNERRGRKRKRSERKRSRKGKRGKSHVKNVDLQRSTTKLQSPSQSTIYTRACKSVEHTQDELNLTDTDSSQSGHIPSDVDSDEFVKSLETSLNHSTLLADKKRTRRREADDLSDGDDEFQRAKGDDRDGTRDAAELKQREERAWDQADEVIRDIQRNKADLAKPAGGWKRELQSLLIDMRHFHLTSHVDRKLRKTILDGDFTVDFRKLTPHSGSRCEVDNQLQVVHQEGSTYFVPVDCDNVKDITSCKQWEVAFKVFMGIYISKWPERSDELLQYSHNVQVAATMYPWENVFNYGIAMREIHTDHPERLWGQICQHTWALELGEPSQKTNFVQANNTSTATPNVRSPRKVCWKFNKGRCTYGAACEYDHRCSVCGGRNHGRSTCYKRGKKDRPRDRGIKREKPDN